jgi:hypothetical protein
MVNKRTRRSKKTTVKINQFGERQVSYQEIVSYIGRVPKRGEWVYGLVAKELQRRGKSNPFRIEGAMVRILEWSHGDPHDHLDNEGEWIECHA